MVTVNRNIAAPRGDNQTSWQQRLDSANQGQATLSLKRLQDRLNRNGHDSGVLTLHHRSRHDRDLSLLRKSEGKLGWFGRRQRAEDATVALQKLFRQAGLQGAEQALNSYLEGFKAPGAGQPRVTAEFVKELLNEHLPAQATATKPDQGARRNMRAGGQIEVDFRQFESGVGFKLLGEGGDDDQRVDGQLIQGEAPNQDRAAVDQDELNSVQSESDPIVIVDDQPVPDRAERARAELVETLRDKKPLRREAILDAVGVVDELKVLGKGTFGEAILANTADGADKVVKIFRKREEKTNIYNYVSSSASYHSGRANEAQQAYLHAREKPGSVEKRDAPLQTRFARTEKFLTMYEDEPGQTKVEMLSPLELRDRMKVLGRDGYISILATVTSKVEGVEPSRADLPNRPDALRNFSRELLAAGQSMVSARLIHRDIKPDNLLFSPDTNQLTVIDLGMVGKQSKTRREARYFDQRAGTPDYLHPRVDGEKYHSYEADLFSSAITLLRSRIEIAPPKQKDADSFEFLIQQTMADRKEILSNIKVLVAEARKKEGFNPDQFAAEYRASETDKQFDGAYYRDKVDDAIIFAEAAVEGGKAEIVTAQQEVEQAQAQAQAQAEAAKLARFGMGVGGLPLSMGVMQSRMGAADTQSVLDAARAKLNAAERKVLVNEKHVATLTQLRDEMDQPDTAANLALAMLDAAAQPYTDWVDQKFALEQYEKLRKHPYIADPQGQEV
jgi:serine/threonine protein kinase